MLLTLTCSAPHAPDFGYLLHKNPANVYRAEAWFGTITVFYPQVEAQKCTVALLLDVDPIQLVRGRGNVGLDQYVNDRPYVASSLLSVAIADAFGTAMNGKSRERPERVTERMPLRAELPVVNCAGGEATLHSLFAPLGYTVTVTRQPLDSRFPEWGESSLYSLTLEGEQTVQDLLTHLYVLIPVLDNGKHYYVGADEVEKLLTKGERWLSTHPEKEFITRRYLAYKQTHIRSALDRLREIGEESTEPQDEADTRDQAEEAAVEAPLRLNDIRLQAVLEAVRTCNPAARSVLDLGCGEGKLLRLLQAERYLSQITGVDVAAHVLERAVRRLKYDALPDHEKQRLRLIQGSVVYRDERFRSYDVAVLVEVIEHLDLPRLKALEQVVFRYANPRRVVVTTPNADYNLHWASLPAGKFRHHDHRFEWTRTQFEAWAQQVAETNRYTVTLHGIGPEEADLGTPTQMAIFDRM